VQGLADDLDLKKILRYLKKAYSTNGTIIEDAEMGSVIRKSLPLSVAAWRVWLII
jgi:translation initiation factor 1